MRYVGEYSVSNKKQRGQMRKMKETIYEINNITWDSLDYNIIKNQKYSHFHIPCSYNFIQSKKTRMKVKRNIIQAFLDQCFYLSVTKPSRIPDNTKIVCAITYPCLWESQIIIFYEKEYFNTFVNRQDSKDYKYTLLTGKSFSKRMLLNIDENVLEKGYLKSIYEDNKLVLTGEIWLCF